MRNVVVWGCHAKFPDVDHAVIKGKPFSEIPANFQESTLDTEKDSMKNSVFFGRVLCFGCIMMYLDLAVF